LAVPKVTIGRAQIDYARGNAGYFFSVSRSPRSPR
jgi:hypothetical protein